MRLVSSPLLGLALLVAVGVAAAAGWALVREVVPRWWSAAVLGLAGVAILLVSIAAAGPPPLRVDDDGMGINYLTVDGPVDDVAQIVAQKHGWLIDTIETERGPRHTIMLDVRTMERASQIAAEIEAQGFPTIHPWPVTRLH